MPRTEVYQLRLTPAEKLSLALKAKERGSSIARMIREDYGLHEARDLVHEIGDLPVERPEEVKAALSTAIHRERERLLDPKLEKLIKQIEAQPGKKSPQEAESLARRRLGMT